nr:small integral membrane protein 15 isoform X1 [Ovis aries]
MTSGAKVGGPQRFQTGSQRPELTRASGRRRGPRASGQTPAGRRRSPRAASPASPRKPRSRPTLPAFPGPTQRWRSRKLAPRLPQAGSGRGPACGRVGRVAASAFLLPAWRKKNNIYSFKCGGRLHLGSEIEVHESQYIEFKPSLRSVLVELKKTTANQPSSEIVIG